jgi:UDP-N-acetylmuramate dehydrogenase
MNAQLRERLVRRVGCTLRQNIPLAPYTSFQIGGPAALLAEPASVAELSSLIRLLRAEAAPLFYLGLGTNILISDAGIDAVVIRATGELCHLWLEGEFVCAGPGARLLNLTTFAAVRGLSGMEKLSGIPGSVGGGLFMNAGAYGGEICETFVDADVLTATTEIQRIEQANVGFAYRSAPAFKSTIILNSRYRLRPGDKRAIFAEMRRVWKLRRAKQPLEFPSAGSIFKRPPGDFAGRLIEAVEGKGFTIGGAMVPEKHAGIFINRGGATAADVTALVREIRRRVFEQFGIMLETEVIPVGFEKDPFQIAQ